ncbi:MAG: thioredoxin family protein [Deltaproteobacteria bacterium]|nr:thioredoxin family protein [Deltaproteobacteria bacterium]
MLAVGCIGSPQREPANETTPKAASSPTPRPSEAASKAATARPRPHFVAPAEGAVDEVVRQALSSAQADGQRLVVYVGATWCEPCEAFHHAVERGELDEPLAGVRFLDFDSDRDGARLTEAGYDGRYIPRFVLPAADGRGSARRIEGGIKGEGAVAHILGRLSPLLAGS